MSNSDIYAKYEYINASPVSRKTMRLLRHSLGTLGQREDHIDDLESWFSSKVVCGLALIGDIIHELAISAKQYVNSTEVIIKKLAYYDVYMLIIPTKPSEHIFFSLYFPGQEGLELICESPFRSVKKTADGGYYTDFCSLRADKFENPATIMERFLVSAAYWSHHYGLRRFSPEDTKKNLNASIMSNVVLLISLENKHSTEEVITVTRYMYMEVMKTNTLISPYPSRLISKLSTCPRSRLELFIIRRILMAFDLMVRDGVKKVGKPETEDKSMMDSEEDVLNADHWIGLINPYTLNSETSGSKVVMLFYLGYAISKNIVSQENSDYHTIEKAIREDRKFDPAEAHKSNGSWDEFEDIPQDKQFSVNVIKYGVELLQAQLGKTFGKDYKTVIFDNILRRLSKHMTSDLASTKASANIDHVSWDNLPEADKELSSKKGRLKVIEALVKEIGIFEHNPYLSLKTIINIVQLTSKGLICDLFKKNQHGGIREIYVLTIKSRILALFVETCARELCSHFDQETMTHPDHKLEVIEAHKARVNHFSAKTERPCLEFHCSADKKCWNNNLVMSALAIPLFKLLPGSVHGCVQTILNMWTKRLVKVPNGVLKLLLAGVQLSCPTYSDMLKEFDLPGSTGKRDLFTSSRSPFAILRTGMMQGILHYTSSLLHVAFLASTKELMLSSFKAFKLPVVPFIDQMCSSDDSATIISVVVDKNISHEQIKTVGYFCEIMCQVLTTFCKYSCFTNSEKSTMGAPHQLEFNSEFIITNTLAVPTFKWLLASLTIAESESLYMRSVSFYNLLSQVSSAGLPAYYTSIVQAVQGILHYRLLGSNTCFYFQHYADEVESYPDPHLGYFIMDNIYVPGALGYSYHHWLHCKTHKMFNLKKKDVLNGSLGFTPDGGITDQLVVHHGDSRRYHALLERMKGGDPDQDLREEVNSHYELLYRQETTKREAEIKLKAKALTPGTAQSLSRGVAFLQAVSMSVYMLYTFCFSRYDSSFVNGSVERTVSKISLMGEIRRRKDVRYKDDYITQEDAEAACFPNHFRFLTYVNVLSPYSSAREVYVTPMRYKKSTIRFPQATSSTPVDLFTLVKEKWFGHVNRYSIQNKEKSWDHYQSLMPWLNERIDQTLNDSPFPDHLSLFNFVSNDAKGTRKFSRVGPAIRASFPIAQVNQLARRTWKDGVILQLGESKHTSFSQFRDRRTSFGLALEIPNQRDRELMVAYAAKNHPVSEEELQTVKGRHRREATLAIIVGVIQGMDNDIIKLAIEQMGHGLFLGWVTSQTKQTTSISSKIITTWTGHGEMTLCNKELTCHVTLYDDKVVELKVNSIRAVSKYYMSVLAALAEQKLKLSLIPMKNSRGFDKKYSCHLTQKGIVLKGDGPGVIQATPVHPLENPDLSNLTFTYRVVKGKIILKQKLKGSSSSHTVLEHSSLDHEFCASQSGEILDDVWMAWYKQAKLSFSLAEQTLKVYADRVREEMRLGDRYSSKGHLSQETTDTRKFLASTLRARLRHKSYDSGYLPAIMKSKIAEDERELDDAIPITEWLHAQDTDVINKDWFIAMANIENISANVNYEEAQLNERVEDALEGTYTVANMDQFYESLMSHRPAIDLVTDRLTSKYSVLPFWDPFIEHVSAYNPHAWTHLLAGREAAGLDPQLSQDIIWILLNTEASPMKILGSKERRVSAEAIHAIYAGSISSRASARSLYSSEVRKSVQNLCRQRLESLRELKSDPGLLSKVLEAIRGAHEEWVEKSVKEDTSRSPLPVDYHNTTSAWVMSDGQTLECGDSVTSTLDGVDKSQYGASEESDDSSTTSEGEKPIRRDWAIMCEEESFVYTDSMKLNVKNLLTDAELKAIWMVFKMSQWDNSISDVDIVAVMYAMRHNKPELITDRPLLTSKFIYFCHIGSEESGHWVCFATGSATADIMFFDGMSSSASADSNYDIAYKMFSIVHPGVSHEAIMRRKMPLQEDSTCGHVCAMWAIHYLKNKIPTNDSVKVARLWTDNCLETKTIYFVRD
uniref:RNA-directed RNA polymerase L n=1 Tax=Salari virus TaxID=2651933 RepID=A0A5Q0TWC4_9VIRU|nr:RNA-dependent RNA polymerase [Salari virus]